MSLQLVIIADDLTGAMDSSEPFARQGASVAVATCIDGCTDAIGAAPDVLAINTESRALPADEAVMAVERTWAQVAAIDPAFLFKKIDSRLKGNVGAETEALARASERPRLIVAPAIPAMGRYVLGGAVTGFGVDMPLPVRASFDSDADLSIPDCGSETALATVAASLIADGKTQLAVGTKGLADAMAAAMARQGRFAPRPTTTAPVPVGGSRLLMLIGSRDPITLTQLDHLRASSLGPVWIDAPNGHFDPAGVPRDAPFIVVAATPGPEPLSSEAVAQNLGRHGHDLLRRTGMATVLASGGDSATAFVRAAGIRTLFPVSDVAPGIPIARAGDGGVRLITKSGGFGDAGTLTDIAGKLVGAFTPPS